MRFSMEEIQHRFISSRKLESIMDEIQDRPITVPNGREIAAKPTSKNASALAAISEAVRHLLNTIELSEKIYKKLVSSLHFKRIKRLI